MADDLSPDEPLEALDTAELWALLAECEAQRAELQAEADELRQVIAAAGLTPDEPDEMAPGYNPVNDLDDAQAQLAKIRGRAARCATLRLRAADDELGRAMASRQMEALPARRR